MSVNPENKCAKLWNKVSQDQISKTLGNQNIQSVIETMMTMQDSLQLHVAKSKPAAGNKAPSDCNIIEGSQFSMYYFGCATAEYYEMLERIHNYTVDVNNEDYFETIYEYIDIWHFLMNVFLYAGVSKDYFSINQELFFEYTNEDNDDRGFEWSESLEHNNLKDVLLSDWGSICEGIGELIGELPFKKWKTYSEDGLKIDSTKLNTIAQAITIKFMFMGETLGVTFEDFKRLYISKNIENFDRQDRGY